MSEPPKRKATLDDFWAIPEAVRFHELIGGELIEKAAPSGEHGDAQAGVVGALRGPFHRGSGRGGVGWWIVTEVEVIFGGVEIIRPILDGARVLVERSHAR